ncbi:hypothetical protein [Halorhabdus rudnickae]|uniref:hypothetical protein n=1 Tax=Halorhabdus rudnickae TaxID=1775544 RepID=UPI0010840144|nr:hypothetical protein [Halorhabdus rudnickae]
MEASDSAAEEAQARLDEVEEDAGEDMDELLEELEQVQAQGPQLGGGQFSSEGESAQSNTSTPSEGEGPDSSGPSSSADREPPGNSWDTTPSTSEFARQVLHENAVADKHLDGDSEPNVAQAAEPDHENRFGGFNSFDPDDVGEWTSVGEVDEEGRGWTVARGAKETADARESAETDFDAVYRTKYGSGDGRISDHGLKTNQMSVYAVTSSLGVETPRFTYDAESDTVIAEGVDQDGRTIWEIDEGDEDLSERANKVDRDEFVDKMAVQALSGNWDLSSANVMIDETGSVRTFDYDRGGREFGDFTSMTYVTKRAEQAADRLDNYRDEPLDVSKEEIAERTAEIAYELERSGRDEEVVAAVGNQMDAIVSNSEADSSEAENHEIVRRNIEVGADVARDRFGWD